jgi:hypothetical protein
MGMIEKARRTAVFLFWYFSLIDIVPSYYPELKSPTYSFCGLFGCS